MVLNYGCKILIHFVYAYEKFMIYRCLIQAPLQTSMLNVSRACIVTNAYGRCSGHSRTGGMPTREGYAGSQGYSPPGYAPARPQPRPREHTTGNRLVLLAAGIFQSLLFYYNNVPNWCSFVPSRSVQREVLYSRNATRCACSIFESPGSHNAFAPLAPRTGARLPINPCWGISTRLLFSLFTDLCLSRIAFVIGLHTLVSLFILPVDLRGNYTRGGTCERFVRTVLGQRCIYLVFRKFFAISLVKKHHISIFSREETSFFHVFFPQFLSHFWPATGELGLCWT